MKEKEKGLFITDSVFDDERLDLNDVVLLSIYRQYTVHGKEHSCFKSAQKLLKEDLHGKMNRTAYQRSKRKLKQLGLIDSKCENGKKERVWTLVNMTGDPCQYDKGIIINNIIK